MNLKGLYYDMWLNISGSLRGQLVGSCETGNDSPA